MMVGMESGLHVGGYEGNGTSPERECDSSVKVEGGRLNVVTKK